MMFGNIFNNKKVLIAGNTGFKGSWISIWLLNLGAKVYGVSKNIPTTPSMFNEIELIKHVEHYKNDVRDLESYKIIIKDIKPDFIFFLVAQSLVSVSYTDPIETFTTNVLGTVNTLDILKELNHKCVCIIITSDKCYENAEWVWGYRETDRLGGQDPYSASKGAAELVIRSYVHSFLTSNRKIRIGIGRAGNVIGGGDWAYNRIVPDCVKAWSKGQLVELRNPKSTRPWQHVLEPLSGYLNLAAALGNGPNLHGEAFNFGPRNQQNYSVLDLVQEMAKHWDQVRWGEGSMNNKDFYESALLKLNCDKALHHLNWNACLPFEQTVKFTTDWYRNYYQDKSNISELTIKQIEEYTAHAASEGLAWAI